MRTRAGHGNTQPAHLSSGDIERNRRVLLEVHGQVDGTIACIVEGAADLGLLLLIEIEARLRVVADPAAGELAPVDVHVARAARLARVRALLGYLPSSGLLKFRKMDVLTEEGADQKLARGCRGSEW